MHTHCLVMLGMHDAMQEAKTQLLLMVDVLRDLDVQHKGGHTAAADMAYLYAMTQVWFTVERSYKVCCCLILGMHILFFGNGNDS